MADIDPRFGHITVRDNGTGAILATVIDMGPTCSIDATVTHLTPDQAWEYGSEVLRWAAYKRREARRREQEGDLMTIINLTPHDMGSKISYPPSGEVARLATIELGTHIYAGVDVPVELVEFHHIQNPPPREDGIWYIVSLPTALAAPRGDFLVPYREVRDDEGRIVGCRMLARPA